MLKKKVDKVSLVFDFDGVIINSHKIKTLAFYNIFKFYGKNFGLKAKKYHLKNIGKPRYIKFKFILKKISYTYDIKKGRITRRKNDYYEYEPDKGSTLHKKYK